MEYRESAAEFDPENEYFRISNLVDQEISRLMAESDDFRATDLLNIIISCTTRLRTVWTFEDLSGMMQASLLAMEHRLQRGEALMDRDTGEYVNLVLAEESEDLGGHEYPKVPDSVPAEWTNGS